MEDHMSGPLPLPSDAGKNGGFTITLQSPDGSISLAGSILFDSFSKAHKVRSERLLVGQALFIGIKPDIFPVFIRSNGYGFFS